MPCCLRRAADRLNIHQHVRLIAGETHVLTKLRRTGSPEVADDQLVVAAKNLVFGHIGREPALAAFQLNGSGEWAELRAVMPVEYAGAGLLIAT